MRYLTSLLALLALSGLMMAGCSSTPEEPAATPVAGSNTAPPAAQAAQTQAQNDMKARANAQGQAYQQFMAKQQGGAPK